MSAHGPWFSTSDEATAITFRWKRPSVVLAPCATPTRRWRSTLALRPAVLEPVLEPVGAEPLVPVPESVREPMLVPLRAARAARALSRSAPACAWGRRAARTRAVLRATSAARALSLTAPACAWSVRDGSAGLSPGGLLPGLIEGLKEEGRSLPKEPSDGGGGDGGGDGGGEEEEARSSDYEIMRDGRIVCVTCDYEIMRDGRIVCESVCVCV